MTQPPGTKLYVVKLCSAEQALEFYDDMETPGGTLYIPDRAVPEVIKKPRRLTITYYLTPEEAELLKNDPRVESVKLHYTERGIKDVLSWNQTANFWKGNYITGNTIIGGSTGVYQSTDKNWGLVKVITGVNTAVAGVQYKWGQSGTDGTFRRLTNISLSTLLDGENVDVVIVDGHLRGNHAEFAVNSDGSGGSRFIQYNWFQHAVNDPTNVDIKKVHHLSAVGKPYDYTDTGAVAGAGDHGSHVAGTVAGNTQGFARKAKIYNISVFDNSVNFNVSGLVWDYIRAFHESKPINPLTGKKNPTVVNASIAQILPINSNDITGFVYRGVTYTGGTFSLTGYTIGGNTREWEDLGISQQRIAAPVGSDTHYTFNIPVQADDVLDDIDDMISSGVIYVTAAGNENWLMDVSGGPDYNNQIIKTSETYYHNRLRSYQTQNSIVVANAYFDWVDYLNASSNRGPAITIIAPGTGIISAVSTTANDILDATSAKIGDRLADPRNLNSDKLEPFNGTSMASPHVAGVIALLASANPDLTNSTALSFLNTHAKTGTMADWPVGHINYKNFSLKGTANKFLYLPPQNVTGTIDKTLVAPSDLVTVTIGGVNLPTGSIIYWTTTGTAQASDFSDGVLKGNVVLNTPSVTLTRTINSSATLGRNFQIELRTGGETGNIHVTTNTITIDNSTTTTTTPGTTTTTTTTAAPGTTTTTTTTAAPGTTTTTTSTTTTTTTQAPISAWGIKSSKLGIGLDECCGKDEHSNLYFSFKTTPTIPPGSGTTTTTTTTTIREIPPFTLPPPPTTTLSEDEIFLPIKDLVPVKSTGRRFIARLRKGSVTGPIVSNSKIISITNLPTRTELPNSFTDSRLSGLVYTNKTKTFHQKTIIDLSADNFINNLFTANSCYDDRVYANVQGIINGTVYGGGKYQDNSISPYSEDSDINAAAVHAGLVAIGERAIVKRYFINYYKGNTAQFIGSSNNSVNSLSRLEGCGYYFDPSGLVKFPPPAPPVLADDFYFSKDTFTTTANQTTVTISNRPGDYISQQCLVFQNGVLLDNSEFTDTAGSTGTVTLLNGVTAGDIITVMSFGSRNFKTGAYPSFTRHSTTLTLATQYVPSGFTITKGVDLIFVNGVILPENDYTITSGTLDMQAPTTGILSIIKWSLNTKLQPVGNPLNTTRNTQVAQTDYNNIISYEPLAFNLYNNGVLMVDAVDYTGTISSYSLSVPPISDLNILLQQTFTRT